MIWLVFFSIGVVRAKKATSTDSHAGFFDSEFTLKTCETALRDDFCDSQMSNFVVREQWRGKTEYFNYMLGEIARVLMKGLSLCVVCGYNRK